MRTQEAVITPISLSETASARTTTTKQEMADEDIDSEEDSWSQCAEELQDYVQLLNELHPSIESWVTLREQSPEPTTEDIFQHSASRIYSEMVRTKFRDAPEELIDVLGDLNYKRYMRLADARNEQFAEVEEVPEAEPLPEKSTSFHDSGIGSSLPKCHLKFQHVQCLERRHVLHLSRSLWLVKAVPDYPVCQKTQSYDHSHVTTVVSLYPIEQERNMSKLLYICCESDE
jgi:hypothetical protein